MAPLLIYCAARLKIVLTNETANVLSLWQINCSKSIGMRLHLPQNWGGSLIFNWPQYQRLFATSLSNSKWMWLWLKCFLSCVNSLPGPARLSHSKQPRLFADLCIFGHGILSPILEFWSMIQILTIVTIHTSSFPSRLHPHYWRLGWQSLGHSWSN